MDNGGTVTISKEYYDLLRKYERIFTLVEEKPNGTVWVRKDFWSHDMENVFFTSCNEAIEVVDKYNTKIDLIVKSRIFEVVNSQITDINKEIDKFNNRVWRINKIERIGFIRGIDIREKKGEKI